MQDKHFTSQQLEEETERVMRAAQEGPVFISDQGRPTYVLVSIDGYRSMAFKRFDIIQLMGQPAGVEDIELEVPERS